MKRLTFSTLLLLGALAGISQVSDAFAPWSSQPSESDTRRPFGTDIQKLSDPATSQAALQSLIKSGASAVPALVRAAQTHDDMATRGWAIHGLAAIESADARIALEALASNGEEDRLVRTWAWAALIHQAEALDELSALATQSSGFPALKRPISLKAVELAGEGYKPGELLSLMGRFPTLSGPLGPLVLQSDSGELARVMVSGESVQTRRMAASYLASQGKGKTKQAAMNATVDTLRFQRDATAVPWSGGALYIPSIQWERRDAIELVGELVAWHVYCEKRGWHQERQQIVNNLRSVGLTRRAGFRHMGQSSDRMLMAFGQVAGFQAVDAILVKTQTRDNPRYANILARLR